MPAFDFEAFWNACNYCDILSVWYLKNVSTVYSLSHNYISVVGYLLMIIYCCWSIYLTESHLSLFLKTSHLLRNIMDNIARWFKFVIQCYSIRWNCKLYMYVHIVQILPVLLLFWIAILLFWVGNPILGGVDISDWELGNSDWMHH